MPDGASYQSHLSADAVAFLLALTRRRQKLVLDLADQISRQPFRIGDYQNVDAEGRTIEHLDLEGFLFSYWVDHGSREVRIFEIVKL